MKSENISIKCSPYAGSNKAYAAFGSSRVLATPREGTRTLHLHVKIEKSPIFKNLFLFFILIEYVMMIKKYTGLYRYFHLKNAGRPKRIGHNTRKSMGAVLCVVRR